MTPEQYQQERKQRGTQESVAALLQISRVTVARRETGELPINREAELAILSLPKKRKRREPTQ
jgi:DNA-binding XRE family transcriptional regulator